MSTKEFEVSGAARELSFSATYVRYLTDTGRLACTRTASGRRRFTAHDLRAFKRRHRRRALIATEAEQRA
jgi:DNA-binding transcriptional MerR regulator